MAFPSTPIQQLPPSWFKMFSKQNFSEQLKTELAYSRPVDLKLDHSKQGLLKQWLYQITLKLHCLQLNFQKTGQSKSGLVLKKLIASC